jgi:hypothetical protein
VEILTDSENEISRIYTIEDDFRQSFIDDYIKPRFDQSKSMDEFISYLGTLDAAFSAFTTPEEFADHLLKGIDASENNPEWKEILEQFGLDIASSLDEVKDYIIDITRTGAAKDIREAIKYLNEKKLKPTQKRLGVSYIEREEDEKDVDPENKSAFYKIFSEAGYTGTEDEFFKEFMPDAERGDIQFISQAMGPGFKLDELSDDPFAALAQVGGMSGEGSDNIFGKKNDDDDDSNANYFNFFDDDKKDDNYYGDAGRDYIKEYTSFFSS